MSQNSGNGFFAMLDRLYRAFVVAYWLFIFFFFPIFSVAKIVESLKRRKFAKKKEEKTYWMVQIVQYLCFLYIAICLYYHIFQDVIGLFVDLETQARITWMFEFATGIPGFAWYFLTDRKIALAGNATDFAGATLIGVVGFILVLLLIDYLKIYGDLDMAGNWVSPGRVTSRENEQFDREEAPYRALSKQLFDHKTKHPRNHPAWDELSGEQREKLTAQWEEKLAEVERARDACPRASYFSQSK